AGGDLFDTKPVYPKHNPNILEGGPSTGTGGTGTSRTPRRGGKVTTGTIPGDPNEQTAEVKPSPSPTVEPTAPLEASDINTRPFKDLAAEVNALIDKKQ